MNRSRPSLDLLINQARELDAGILLISEPNNIPSSDNWYVSSDGGAAIFVDSARVKLKSCLAKKSSGFVAVYCGSYLIISIYAPPP